MGLLVLRIVAVMLLALTYTAAQQAPHEPAAVDPDCVADDENFVRLYDMLAFSTALITAFILPFFWPFVPGVINKWNWASAYRRWWQIAVGGAVLFLLVVFLPPQLARVGLVPDAAGLAVFNRVGNVRLEYLACDMRTIPRDYGFYFFGAWDPGPDSLIIYWWSQVLVYLTWMVVFGLAYLALTKWLPRKRLETIGR